MAIALGNALVTGSSSANQSTAYATAALTNAPGAGRLVVLFVTMAATASPAPTATVTGGGMTTWTRHATNIGYLTNAAPTFRTMMFFAQQAGAGATTALSILPSAAAISCCWSAFELTGTHSDTAGNGAGCFVQVVTTFADTNATSITGTNLAAAGAADNRPIACTAHTANEAETKRATWTNAAAAAFIGTPGTSQLAQIRTDAYEQTYSATWTTLTGAKSGAIAAEVKAVVAAGGVTRNHIFIVDA